MSAGETGFVHQGALTKLRLKPSLLRGSFFSGPAGKEQAIAMTEGGKTGSETVSHGDARAPM